MRSMDETLHGSDIAWFSVAFHVSANVSAYGGLFCTSQLQE